MAKKEKFNSTNRYGARYGKTTKKKIAMAEKGYRGKNKCPYCKKVGVKRVATGIWYCAKCDSRFTARAYSLEVSE